jgi:hypothetical protein
MYEYINTSKSYFIPFLTLKTDENTWFGGNLKLNQTDILKNIEPKPLAQYEAMKSTDKMLRRSKSMIWPHSSEYESKFAINSSTNEL